MDKSKKRSQHQSGYLQRINFDPKLWNNPVAKYLTNIRLVLLLVMTLILLGTMSYTQLPKRLNPEIEIPIVSIITVLPGSSPEDIESLITIPLENELKGLTGIDVMSSVSSENVSAITIQFLSSVTPKDAESQVQAAVDTVTDLPEDAQRPRVGAFDFEDQPVLTFAVTTSTNDLPSLMSFSKQLEDTLKADSKVDRVSMLGFESQEVVIEMRPDQLAQYNLTPFQLSSLITAAVPSYPAGSVSSGSNTFSITIDPTLTTIADLRALLLTVNGQTVQLGEIATVQQRSMPEQQLAFLATHDSEPVRAVTFNVFKTKTSNISEAADRVLEIVEHEVSAYDNRFTVSTIMNTGEEVNKQFVDLLGEFRTTILLVFGCLFLFLGLRQAVIASLTIPLTFVSAFIFMGIFGMSINFLSLFAFLLVLGLIVDDSIVVVATMTQYFKTKKFSPQETGLLVWRDNIVPIWSTTLTTIWSFVPLLLSTGIIGEFIKPIPVIVTVTMLSSTAIAVLVTLPFMITLLEFKLARRVSILLRVLGILLFLGILLSSLKGNPLLILIVGLWALILWLAWRIRSVLWKTSRSFVKKSPMIQDVFEKINRYSSKGVLDLRPIEGMYHRLILRVLKSKSARRNVIVAGIVYTVLAFLLIPLGLVKNEFFPKVDADQLTVIIDLPSGSNSDSTQQEAQQILTELRDTPELNFVISEVGVRSDGFGGRGDSRSTITFTLYLGPADERDITSIEIANLLREEFDDYSRGELSVVEVSGGPPAGADIELKLLGEDLGVLNRYADQLVQYLESQPGVINVDKSVKAGTSAIVFVPDLYKMNQAGVTSGQIALWLRTYASGFTLDEINFAQQGEEKQDVVLRFDSSDPLLSDLDTILIPTPNGNLPLNALGHFQSKANPVSITRENSRRTMNVSASVQTGYSVSDMNKELLDYVATVEMDDGYEYDTGGVNEENEKSVQSILQAMIVAFILILVTMVVQFGSFRQAIIVLLVIPLAVSSVFYTFGLTGTPLSFPALIGILSLFGIVVANSMFIVDKININLKEGLRFNEAIADAGSSRLEPIILTKLSTVLGLLPITLADPLWRGLGGAIISGLLLASTIMLLFIPVVYYSWFAPSKER